MSTASEQVKVAAVVVFYMSSALVMVFVNKAVLNNSPELSLVFLLLQLIIAVVLLQVAASLSSRIKLPKVTLDVAKNLFPVVSVNIAGLVFNTLCLRDVEASFFQIARGLVLPLTIAVSSIHTKTHLSARVLLAATVVTVGFFLGIAPERSVPSTSVPSGLSLVYGVLSSLFIALHSVLIKESLRYCNDSTIELAWWTNAGSALLILPMIVFRGELSKLYALSFSETWDGHVFAWGSLVTGVVGFLLSIAGVLSIKVTSPITHMFSSAAKSVIQTTLGVYIFKDVLTMNRIASLVVISAGTMYYTWIKSSGLRAPPRQTAVKDVEKASRVG